MFEIKKQDGLRIVHMAHGKVNALDLEFCLGLTSILQELSDDESSSGVILTAKSRVFSAGVDLKRLIGEEKPYLEEFLPALIAAFEALFCFPKPLVAAINGHAVAGGCIIASACDYRLLSPTAKIGIPELRVGVPLPSVALEIMRMAVAPQAFQKMVFMGATYSGEDALANGLADELVEREQQLEMATEKVKLLGNVPADVFALTKKQLRKPALDYIAAGCDEFQEQVFELWRRDDIRRVIRTYVDQRL